MSGFHVRVSVGLHLSCSFTAVSIGLAEGRAIPILGGGKMTGKIGPYGIGMLNVLTDKFQEDDTGNIPMRICLDEPRTNYSVIRVNRDISTGINCRRYCASTSKMLIRI